MSRAILSLIPRLYSNTANPPRYPMQPLDHPLPALTSPEANPRPIPPAPVPFTIVASLSWAMIMYMFRHRGERLQPGIVNSMRKLGEKREDRVLADTAQVISTTSRTPGTTSRRSSGTTSKTTPNQRVCLTLPTATDHGDSGAARATGAVRSHDHHRIHPPHSHSLHPACVRLVSGI